MKLATIFYSTLFLLLACNSSDFSKKEAELRQREIELKEREIALREKKNKHSSSLSEERNTQTISLQDPPVGKTKYLFIVIDTNEPRLEQRSTTDLTPNLFSDEPMKASQPENYLVPEFYKYKSDVIEVQDYNEDKKYKEIDKFQELVEQRLRGVNQSLDINNNSGIGKPAKGAQASIIFKKAFVFDSYKDASVERDNKINK